MRVQISTEDVPERDRFAAWAGTVHDALGLEAEPLPDASGPFRGQLAGHFRGSLFNVRVNADAHRISGRTLGGTRQPWDGYRIYREASAGAWFRLSHLEGVTRAGDLIIYDTDIPLETQPCDDYRLEIWTMPKRLLGPHLPATGQPLATMLSGRDGVATLAASYLEALTREWENISDAAMGPVVDTLSRLIGIACGMAAEAQPEAVRAGRLVEARRHIDRQLADPALSPASVAAAMGIAVRTLHLVFEPTGGSFTRYVRRRRLEQCRAALLSDPRRAVTDIAFAWGFNSLSGFYSAFQAAFGMPPGDLRAAAREQRHF